MNWIDLDLRCRKSLPFVVFSASQEDFGTESAIMSTQILPHIDYGCLLLFSGLRSKCTSPYLGAVGLFTIGGNDSLIRVPF